MTWEIIESEGVELKDKPVRMCKQRPTPLFDLNTHCHDGQCTYNDVCFALPPWSGGDSCTFLHTRQSRLQQIAYFRKGEISLEVE